MPPIQFAVQTYLHTDSAISAERAVNCYAEAQPKDAKTPVALLGAPGIAAFGDLGGNGPVRGLHEMKGVLYGVAGTSLYMIDPNGNRTLLGAGIAGFGCVSMADNGGQLIVSNGVGGFVYAPTGISTTLAATALAGAHSVLLDDATGVAVGHHVTILLDSGATLSTSVNSIAAAPTIGIVDPLPSNASQSNTFTDTDLTYTQIGSVAFHPANNVTYFDNYFVLSRTGTNIFFFSGILAGTSYDGLDFNSADVSPDLIIAVATLHQALMVFMENTVEVWYDSGDVNSPFQRYNGGTVERGCAAPLSVVKEDNSLFFLGSDLTFYRLDYLKPVRVSTHAIEAAWRKYGFVGDAFSFSYTFNGHKFIVLTFPSAPSTWEYDIATQLWHERESWDSNGATLSRWRVNCYARCYNRDIVGDAFSGKLGTLDETVFTEFGNTMQMSAVSPPIHADRHRVFNTRLELDVRAGVGLATGQGSDPQLMLDWSDDGGNTWSELQEWNAMGKIGAYVTRLRWLRKGQFRQRVYRISISDPVRRSIIRAHADLDTDM